MFFSSNFSIRNAFNNGSTPRDGIIRISSLESLIDASMEFKMACLEAYNERWDQKKWDWWLVLVFCLIIKLIKTNNKITNDNNFDFRLGADISEDEKAQLAYAALEITMKKM